MRPKRNLGTVMTVLLLIILPLCLLSCGDADLDIDQEQTEEPLKFIEFVLFPTAPYIDKSYVEKVPEEEVAVGHIDFDAEKEEIQRVYTAFVRAYVEEDMTALQETLDISTGIEWGTSVTGNVYGWHNIRTYIQTNWSISDCEGDLNWELTDFYIRPQNVRAPWTEASAKGQMFYYGVGAVLIEDSCHNDIGRFYFTKKSSEWRIHQIDGSKYFADDKYKAP
ncbi:hypothetical protein C6499_15035 [Candidatus Poribacteria bacterium]|nr:MAG: hypothetical protein C6499_15035 [Candidatus Poribacteria bacterium]